MYDEQVVVYVQLRSPKSGSIGSSKRVGKIYMPLGKTADNFRFFVTKGVEVALQSSQGAWRDQS